MRHLLNVHKITDTTKCSSSKQFKLTDMNFCKNNAAGTSCNSKQFLLARNIALWFARDNLPFNTVSKEGFENFCRAYKIISNEETLPCPETISGRALEDIYLQIKMKVKNLCEEIKHCINISFDAWTDNCKRISYITITAHFIDNEWRLNSLVLGTPMFPHPHTGINTKEAVDEILIEFKLNGLKRICTTDRGANMLKAVREMEDSVQNTCAGHGCHNLLTTDILKSEWITNLISRMKTIYKHLIFKYHDLKLEIQEEKEQNFLKLINDLESIGKKPT